MIRRYLESNGWIPYCVCDSVTCYWNGSSFRAPDGSHKPTASSKDWTEQGLNMVLAGDFCDWLRMYIWSATAGSESMTT